MKSNIKYRNHVYALIFGIIASVISIIISKSDFLIVFWVFLNIPSVFVGILTTQNVHDFVGIGFHIGVLVQWYLIFYFILKMRSNRNS